MVKIYPLQFQPEMKSYIWGGRNLSKFGFELPEGPIGEAWMISDHPTGITKVAHGAWRGMSLEQLREQYPLAVFGAKGLSGKSNRFPLLIKLLDCQDNLSVQVHPSDEYVRLAPHELGKTEMWYVIDAQPGAKIIFGLKPGVTRQQLADAIAQDQIMDTLHQIEVQAGDAFFIPAGTVHALGGGILLAEIQQNSDKTYRLYDYHRVGLDGKPRALHIEDSLNVIHYEGLQATKQSTAIKEAHQWLCIAQSNYFIVDKALVRARWSLTTNPDSFEILIVTEGSGTIEWQSESASLTAGDCYLLPALLGSYTLEGHMTVLRSYLP